MVTYELSGSRNGSETPQYWPRFLVVFLVATANIAALAPVVLALGNLDWLLVMMVGAFAVSAFGLLFTGAPGSRHPGLWEPMFGWFGATALPALVSIAWPILYLIVIAVANGVAGVFAVSINTYSIALWISGILAGAFGCFFLLVNDLNLSAQLFPSGIGAKSAFDDFQNKQRGKLTWAVGLLVAILLLITALILTLFGNSGFWFWVFVIVLEMYLLLAGGYLWFRNAIPGRSDEVVSAVDSVARLFEVAGFEVETYAEAMTGNMVFDLGPIFIYVRINDGSTALCIVKLMPIDDSDIETCMADLTRASWVLGATPNSLDSKLYLVLALVINAEGGDSQPSCDKQDGIWVLRIANSDVGGILNAAAVDAKRKQRAQSLLGLSVWLGNMYVPDDGPEVDEVHHGG